MKFEDLDAFLDVARLGGFSRAAAHRRVAQSALSRRVARLEHELGIQLFERKARGVQLTENGAVLFGRANTLASQLDEIEKETRELSDVPRGEVRIATPPLSASALAPRAFKDIREQFPEIRLSIREGSSGQIHSWILSGEIDVALLLNPEESVELRIVAMVNAPIFLVVPRQMPPELAAAVETGLTSDGRFRFKMIGSLPLIMPGPLHGVRKQIERMAAEHRVSTNVIIESDGLGIAVVLAKEGLGCTVFSYPGQNDSTLRDQLRLIPFAPPVSWTFALVCKAEPKPSRAVAAVTEVFHRHINLLAAEGYWTEKGRGGA